jgi:hypothetical protein
MERERVERSGRCWTMEASRLSLLGVVGELGEELPLVLF